MVTPTHAEKSVCFYRIHVEGKKHGKRLAYLKFSVETSEAATTVYQQVRLTHHTTLTPPPFHLPFAPLTPSPSPTLHPILCTPDTVTTPSPPPPSLHT